MNKYETLLNVAEQDGITVTEQFDLSGTRIKGLYCDNVIAIKHDLETDIEKACVLAEELGHYYTTSGDIIEQRSVMNQKQELRARLWAYNKMIGLQGLIRAYKHGCTSVHEVAEYLEVTEDFLLDSISAYKKQYGCYARIDNYAIYFEPFLGVFELKNS